MGMGGIRGLYLGMGGITAWWCFGALNPTLLTGRPEPRRGGGERPLHPHPPRDPHRGGPGVYLYIYPSVHLSVYLSIYMHTYMYIYMYIYM